MEFNRERKRYIAEKLAQEGYTRFAIEDVMASSQAEALWNMLRVATMHLPLDPYCKDGNRFRIYQRYIYFPWDRMLVPWPPQQDEESSLIMPYYQGTEFQSDPNAAGVIRKFQSFPQDLAINPNLHLLISTNFDLIPWREQKEFFNHALKVVQVGVHLVRIEATPGLRGLTSPNCLHQDGEPFTFVHLIERFRVRGGINILAPTKYVHQHPNDIPTDAAIASFIISKPLESYAICDEALSHYASEVEVEENCESGWRAILIVDYTPLEPKLSPVE